MNKRLSFDEWMQEVYLHSAARNIEPDSDKESYREDYENGLEPWESAEGV